MEAKVRFVSPMERALYLKSLESLQPDVGSSGALPLSPAEIAAFAARARERFFGKGSVIFPPGEPPGSFHVVVEGKVRVRGAEHGTVVLGPGETLGFLSLLAHLEHGPGAVAEQDTLTLEIAADDLQDLLEDHFAVLLRALRGTASRMLDVRRKIPDGAYLAPAEGVVPPPERELDLMDRLLYLRRGNTFRTDSLDSMIELARETREVRFEAGTTLWRAGDPSGFLYLLISGSARCTLPAEERSFRAGPGYPLGNLESLAGRPRWVTAVTETPVVALRADTETFIDILEDHFDMARHFLAVTASGLLEILEENRGPEAADRD